MWRGLNNRWPPSFLPSFLPFGYTALTTTGYFLVYYSRWSFSVLIPFQAGPQKWVWSWTISHALTQERTTAFTGSELRLSTDTGHFRPKVSNFGVADFWPIFWAQFRCRSEQKTLCRSLSTCNYRSRSLLTVTAYWVILTSSSSVGISSVPSLFFPHA